MIDCESLFIIIFKLSSVVYWDNIGIKFKPRLFSALLVKPSGTTLISSGLLFVIEQLLHLFMNKKGKMNSLLWYNM